MTRIVSRGGRKGRSRQMTADDFSKQIDKIVNRSDNVGDAISNILEELDEIEIISEKDKLRQRDRKDDRGSKES